MGLLHAPAVPAIVPPPNQAAQSALQATDTIGAEPGADEQPDEVNDNQPEEDDETDDTGTSNSTAPDASDEFEVTSPDVRHPSTIGISFCVQLDARGSVAVRLPQSRTFFWQPEGTPPFQLNGRYEACTRRWTDDNGVARNGPIWRRMSAVLPDAAVTIDRSELVHGRVVRKDCGNAAGFAAGPASRGFSAQTSRTGKCLAADDCPSELHRPRTGAERT